MIEASWVKERIERGEYYFSRHGDQERQNDNLTIAEVEDALQVESWNTMTIQGEEKVV